MAYSLLFTLTFPLVRIGVKNIANACRVRFGENFLIFYYRTKRTSRVVVTRRLIYTIHVSFIQPQRKRSRFTYITCIVLLFAALVARRVFDRSRTDDVSSLQACNGRIFHVKSVRLVVAHGARRSVSSSSNNECNCTNRNRVFVVRAVESAIRRTSGLGVFGVITATRDCENRTICAVVSRTETEKLVV